MLNVESDNSMNILINVFCTVYYCTEGGEGGMENMKTKDQVAGPEIAGPENAGHKSSAIAEMAAKFCTSRIFVVEWAFFKSVNSVDCWRNGTLTDITDIFDAADETLFSKILYATQTTLAP